MISANRYNVVVEERSGRIHLSIERKDGKEIILPWDALQDIKNEYVGRNVTMVEYFPETWAVVDEVNRRHFWSTDETPPMTPSE